jgi:abortive infection bacteriophage resistance protein
MIQYFLFTVSPNNTFEDKLKALLVAYPNIDAGAMGFPDSWKNEDIWKSKSN